MFSRYFGTCIKNLAYLFYSCYSITMYYIITIRYKCICINRDVLQVWNGLIFMFTSSFLVFCIICPFLARNTVLFDQHRQLFVCQIVIRSIVDSRITYCILRIMLVMCTIRIIIFYTFRFRTQNGLYQECAKKILTLLLSDYVIKIGNNGVKPKYFLNETLRFSLRRKGQLVSK